jgi:hypothetical protein
MKVDKISLVRTDGAAVSCLVRSHVEDIFWKGKYFMLYIFHSASALEG